MTPVAEAQRYAADRQYQASLDAIAAWQEQNKLVMEEWKPWRQVGMDALTAMRKGMGLETGGALIGKDEYGAFEAEFKAPTMVDDPGYAFRKSEGEKAISRALGSRGVSGGAKEKALLKYNQELASQEYGAAYGRAMSEYQARQGQLDARFGRLGDIAGYGYGGTREATHAGMRTTGEIANAMQEGAAAQGSGAIGAANAMTQGAMFNAQAKQAQRAGIFNTVLMGAGAYMGGRTGGPEGAARGAAIGGAFGGMLTGNTNLSFGSGALLAGSGYLSSTWGGERKNQDNTATPGWIVG